jgi:uncharacterized protein YerC
MNTRKEHREAVEKLVEYLRANPQEPYRDVSAKIGLSVASISRIATAHGLTRRKAALSISDLSKLEG